MNKHTNPSQNNQHLLYDPTVEDVDLLLAGLADGVVATPLVPGSDVMATLRDVLDKPELRFLHILGHGAPGEVFLGGERIDADRWRHEAANSTPRINPIQINFWSCRTGEGEPGMSFINTVAQTSQAFVNAASGYVGHESKGGSWELDVSAKAVVPFSSLSLTKFESVLATVTLLGTEDPSLPQNDSSTGAINVTALTGRNPDVLITSVDASKGTLFFATNSATGHITWQALDASQLDATHGLFLPDAALIYFVPAANSNGTLTDAITYKGWDSHVAGESYWGVKAFGPGVFTPDVSTDSFTASFDISSVNDAPKITVTANDFTEDAGGLTVGSVAGSYVTEDQDTGDTLTVAFNTSSTHYTLDTANNKVLLTQAGIDAINAGKALDAIDLKVTDASSESSTGSDTPVVTPVNDAPKITVTANDFTEDAGGLTVGSVAGSYVTEDQDTGDTLTVAFNTSSTHYTLDTANNKVLLTQAGIDAINAGKALDAIDLKVTDASSESSTGSDTPVVTPVNDAPKITVTANDFTEDAGGLTVGSVAGSYVTEDQDTGDTLTVAFNTSSTHYTLDTANNKVLLTQAGIDAINAGKALDAIDLKVTDASSESSTGSDTPVVTPVNDAPKITVTANDFTEDAGGLTVGSVAGSYVTEDQDTGDTLTVAFNTSSTHYTLDTANNKVLLTQAGIDAINAGKALDAIDLKVTDASSESSTGSDTPVVTPVNDAPKITVTANDFTEDAGGLTVGSVAGSYVTEDQDTGDTLTVAFNTSSTHYTLDTANNKVLLTQAGIDAINAGKALDAIDLKVTDASSESSTGSDTPVVTPVNDAPKITVTANDFTEDAGGLTVGSVAGSYVTEDQDTGDTLTVAFNTSSTHYTLDTANNKVLLTQAGIDAINAGKALDAIDLKVTDASSESSTGSDTPVVTPVNDAPKITVTANDFTEDAGGLTVGSVAGSYVTEDQDTGDTLTVAFNTSSTHYTLDTANNKVLLTQAGIDAINAGKALDAIDLKVTDASSESSTGSDTPVVTPVNDAPKITVTANDFTEDAGGLTVGSVAGSYVTEDQDTGDTLTVAFNTSSTHYTLDTANNKVLLTQAGIDAINAGKALDAIDLKVTDASSESSTGSDTPVVTPVNDAPKITVTANDFTEDAGGLTVGSVAGSYVTEDQDTGDTLTVAFNTSSTHYTLDTANNKVLLTQAGIDAINAGKALDAIDLKVTDASSESSTGSDTPVVTPVNDAPKITVTANDFTEDAGGLTVGSVAGSYVTEDQDTGDTLTVAFNTSSTHYTLDTANNKVLLTQAGIDAINAGKALDAIDLKVTDASSESSTGSDTPVVTPVNDAPKITVTANDFTEDAGGLTVGSVAGSYVTEDQDTGDTLTVAFNTSSTHYTLDTANNKVLLTQAGIDAINAGKALDAIDLKVTDASSESSTGSDTPVVTPVNDAPKITVTANDFTEDAGGLTVGSVAGSYVTEDQDTGDTLTVAFNTSSTHYTLDTANNKVLLTQAGIDAINAGKALDAIDLKVTDASSESSTGSDTPVVTPVNDAPKITVTANDFTEDAGGLTVGSVAGSYVTEDQDTGDTLTVAFNTSSTHYTLDTANNKVLLTQAGIDAINAGKALDAIDLKVTDASSESSTGSDTPVVTPVNDAPISGSTTPLLQGIEDTPYKISVAQLLEGFTDEESDQLSVVNLTATNATVTVDTAGGSTTDYIVTPNANYNGEVTLSYDVSDGVSTTNMSRTLNFSPVPDAPVTTNDDITLNEDALRVLALTDFGTYSDADSDALDSIKLTVLPATGKLELFDAYNDVWQALTHSTEIAVADIDAGKLRFVPDANTYSTSPALYSNIGFQVKDSTGDYSETKQLDVNVLAVPDTFVSKVSTDNLVNIVEAGGVVSISGVKDAGDTVDIKLGSATFTDTSATGTWSVDVPAGSLQPGANAFTVTSTNPTTNNTTTGYFSVSFDNAHPVVTDAGVVVTVNHAGAANIGDTVTMRFTTADTDVDSVVADFSQFGATQSVSAVPLGGGVYEAKYTIAANGTVTGSAKVGVTVTDVAGNVSSIVDSTTFAVDDIMPKVNIYRTTPIFNADGTVASVSSVEPNATTKDDAVYFKAVFSELVSGVGLSNFTTGQGQIQQVIQLPPSSSNQSVFLVKVGGIENFNGDVGISISNTSNSIVDLAGNPFFETAENHRYILDNTPPPMVNVFNAQLVSTSTTTATVNINKLAGAEPGVGIKVYEGNTLLATTTANANGDIAVEVSLTQSANPHDLQIKTVDAVGNESELGAVRKIYVATVDDLAPLNGAVLTNPKSIQYGDSIVLTSEASISELSFLQGLLNPPVQGANLAPGYLSFNKIADSIANLVEGATGTYAVNATASPFINAPYVVGGVTVEVLGDGSVGQLTALKLALAAHAVGSDLVNQGRLVVDQVSGTAAELLSPNGQALITSGVDVRVTEPATVSQISDLKGDVTGGGVVQYTAITDTLVNIKDSLSSGIIQDGVSLNVSINPAAMAATPASISIADWKLLKAAISNGTPPDGALNANVSDTAANIRAELFAEDGSAITNNFFNSLTAGRVIVDGAADVGLLQALKTAMGGPNDYGRIEYSAVTDTFANLTSFTYFSDNPDTPNVVEQTSYLAGKIVTVTDQVSVGQATSPNFNSAAKINYTSISGDVGAFVTHATDVDGFTTYTTTSFVQAGTKVVINQSASIAELEAIKSVTTVEYSAITDFVENLFDDIVVNSLVVPGTDVSVLGASTISQLTKLDAANGPSGELTYSSVSDTESNLFTGNPLLLSAYVKPGTNVDIQGAVSVDLIDDLSQAVTAGGSTGVINFTAVHGALSDFLNADNSAKTGLDGLLNGKTIHVDGSLNKAQYEALQSLNGTGDLATSVTANSLDIQQPTLISIAPANDAGPDTNLQTLTYEVKFNESVKGVKPENFSIAAPADNQGQPVWSITGAQPVNAVDGLSSKWLVTVAHQAGDTSFTQGEVKVSLSSGVGIQDGLGNSFDMGGIGSSMNGYQVDYQAPLVTDASINVSVSGSGAANVGDTVTVTFAAAEPSTVIQSVTVDFAEFGAKAPVTAIYNSVSDRYEASYQLAPNGTVTGSAKASITVTDKAGNATTFVDGTGFAVDDIVPVATMTRVNPVMDNGQLVDLTPAGQETKADALYFKVHFSEAMTGIGLEHFEVVGNTSATVQWVNQLQTKGDYLVKVAGGDLANLTHEVVSIGFTSITPTDLAGNLLNKVDSVAEAYLMDNDLPSIGSEITESVNENTSVIYTATATDPTSEKIAFTLKESGDASLLNIDSATGNVTLKSGAAPDFETKAGGYSFTVVATDAAGNATEQTVTLGVNNLDEVAPTITSAATAAAINENSVAGKVVYTATSTDTADISGGVTYSLKDVGDVSAFSIDASTGAVTLTGSPDFETKAGGYSFTVVATDAAGNATEQTVTLGVNNLDEVAPTITSAATAAAINENSVAGKVVYTATSTDTADISGGVTYSLKGVDDASAFSIDASTGAVTLTGKPDFETKAGYSFTVVATDAAGNAKEQAVTLGVNNLDEVAPTITSAATAAAINENSVAGKVVYTATSTDTADISGGVTYSLKGVDDASAFSIDASTGAVTLTGSPDFETKAGGYSFTVVATDAAGNAKEQAVTLGVNNLDEVAPTITSAATAAAINENSVAGKVVYTATSTDTADISGGVTYSLKGVDDASAFSIDASTGAVTLTGSPDFETKAGGYSFTVVATDAAGNAKEQAVTLGVNNLDEVAPTITSAATAAAINENSVAGKVVYTATSTDTADISGGVTYSLKGVDDASAFSIDASTGAVTLTGKPDFETKTGYSFTVVATDAAGNATEQTVTLGVNNLDEVAPTITSAATAAAINENSVAGKVVYTATSTDTADISGGVTYSLKGVDDASAFSIDASTGAVTLTGSPDFETKAGYSFTVVATDAAGNAKEQAVTLGVNNLDDTAPVITTSDAVLKVDDTATVTFTFAQSTTGFDLSQIQSGSGSWVNGSLTAVAGSNNQVWTAQFTPNANVANASAAFKYHPTVPVAQVDTVTLAGTPEIGDSYQVTINGTTYSQAVTSSVSTLADVKAGLISTINAVAGGVVIAAAGEGNTLVLTAKAAGVSFAASSAASNHVIDATEDATVSVTTANVAVVAAVTEVAAVAAVPAVSQVSTVSLSVLNGGVVTGEDSVTVTIAGKAYKVDGSTSVNTVAKLTEAVNAAINADASAAVTSTYVAGETNLTLTAKSANPTFTLAVTDNVANSVVSSSTITEGSAAVAGVVGVPGVTGVAAVAQVDTVTLAGTPEIGDSYQVTIDGTTYSQAVTSSVSTLADVKAALVNTINAATGIAVTATEGDNNTLVLTAKTAGTAFTASARATDRAAVDDQAATLAHTTANVAFNGVTDHAGNRGLTDGAATNYSVDTVAPTVTSFSTDHANGSVKAGEVIQITATTSEAMAAGSKVIATLSTGAVVELVATNAGTTLTGSYTVGATDTSSDLTVSSYALATGDGVAPVDAAGNAMTSTALPSGVYNIGGANEIVIDTAAPTVLNFSTSTSDGIYKAGSTVTITATASETLAAGSKVTVGLSGGGSVELTANSDGNTLTGTYTVQAGQNSIDLTVVGYQLGASGSYVPVDMAGNAMSATTVPTTPNNLGDVASIVVDTQAPTVTGFATSHADGSFKAGEVITITATSSETLVAGSTITATLSSGATVDLVAANNGTTLTGNYTIAAGQNTSDLTISSYALASGNAAPKDAAGNVMTSTAVPTGANNLAGDNDIVIDTLAPDATLTANTAVMEDGRVDAAEMQSGVASVTAEAGALLSVTFTGTAGSITRSLGTATGSAQTISLNAGDDVTLGQGAVSVSVTATDAASNLTTKSGANFSLHTETITTDGNGAVSIGQLSVNGASTGSVINPFDGSVLGSGDKLDLSAINGNVVVDNVAGQVFAKVGGKQLSALIGVANTSDVIAGFDVITTGSGDDRIIGNDGLSEVFYAGAGRNQINGGSSFGTVDYVDYRAYAKPAQATVGGATNANTRTLTLTTNNLALGDVYTFKSGSMSVSVTATSDMIATPALLVSALAAQLSQYTMNGNSLNGLQITASGNVISFTAGGDFDATELNTLLSVATVALVPETGVSFDLSSVVDLSSDLNAWGTSAYMAVRSDGSVDELTSIEGVLGTAYDDIIIGSDGDNIFLGDAGDDVIRGNGGNDVLIGGAGDDQIFGGVGSDRIIGGAGRDKIYGGTGKDTIVIGLDNSTTSDSIRDFDVSTILTGSAGRSGQALDKIDFNFTNAELAAKLALAGYASVPATLNYKVALAEYTGSVTPAQASAATPYSRVLELSVEASLGDWVKVSEVRMDWESNPFGTLNPDEYILSAIKVADALNQASDPALLSTFDTSSADNHRLFAAIQFQRVGEIIDTTAAEAIVGARTGDFFVMSGGDDVLVGGLGSDRYEARILGASDNHSNGRVVVNDLGRAGGGLEQDAVFIEGARNLGDLDFIRTQIAGEQAGRSLNIAYEQYRGVDDPTTAQNEVNMLHAHGQIDIFNQFSLTQGDLYAVEKIQLAEEVENPLAAAVQTYYLGKVTGATSAVAGAAAGDVIHASADQDSLLIGTAGHHDSFVIDKPTSKSAYDSTNNVAADSQDVWIYGMDDAADDVVVKVGSGTTSHAYNEAATLNALKSNGFTMTDFNENGLQGKKATVVLNGTTSETTDDVTLNIFFADAGNVDSTSLLNRIKWES